MNLGDPREEVVRAFWNSLSLGALFSLIFTLILGVIALLVLFERRWTSVWAYATTGVVVGAVGSLLFLGLAGALIGAVSGALAGVASWYLLSWGGEPCEEPVAAA
jgi:hypothetical protein